MKNKDLTGNRVTRLSFILQEAKVNGAQLSDELNILNTFINQILNKNKISSYLDIVRLIVKYFNGILARSLGYLLEDFNKDSWI
ncbi:hypothetical protein NF27_DA00090 [Candidatus Jidaibacter acanthamoeba]|uniref:Uncharacterized protein n=1 Tax=Candidatus Jidaibacter acanthamoebae TaxID=86105 RepID=A0A0C1R0B5_9RICK|nr:hypothetical protein [Candidatus Jidaibacter acanthamoeba]KIE05745.1 hypothetical protein NF27_DA00090 [Candidatus Jidaibacter acanthamoeba]